MNDLNFYFNLLTDRQTNFQTFKVLVVNRGSLMIIFFFAYLHELGHVKKIKKSWENEESLSWPPPCWEIFQLFFFSYITLTEPFQPNVNCVSTLWACWWSWPCAFFHQRTPWYRNCLEWFPTNQQLIGQATILLQDDFYMKHK